MMVCKALSPSRRDWVPTGSRMRFQCDVTSWHPPQPGLPGARKAGKEGKQARMNGEEGNEPTATATHRESPRCVWMDPSRRRASFEGDGREDTPPAGAGVQRGIRGFLVGCFRTGDHLPRSRLRDLPARRDRFASTDATGNRRGGAFPQPPVRIGARVCPGVHRGAAREGGSATRTGTSPAPGEEPRIDSGGGGVRPARCPGPLGAATRERWSRARHARHGGHSD